METTPGQPGVLPNLETGTAQMAGEPSQRGLQPKETLPITGTLPSGIHRPTKDQVRKGGSAHDQPTLEVIDHLT